MAMDPYKKRMLQGAAQGATTGATAGYMLGGPIPGTVGLIGGGVAGALMARPGEDEQRFRARMRQLELGVLGPEEAAIRGRFMDPVRGAAQQQETARRALEQGTVTSGASARRAQAAQTAARRDIGEAAAEAEMAIMDLGERRRMMADRMRDQLRREEDQRTRQFRAQMAGDLVGLGETVGGDIAQQRLSRQAEKALLADQVEPTRRRLFQSRGVDPDLAAVDPDLASMADEDLVDAYTGGLPFIDFGGLPEAGEVDQGTGAAAQADALEAAYRDSPFLFGEATPAAPEPSAPTRRAAATAAPPAAFDYSAADADTAFEALGLSRAGVADPDLAARMLATPDAGVPDPDLAARMLATDLAGVPDPDLAARMVGGPGVASRMGDAMAARRLGVSIDTADPEYVGFSQAYIGLDPDDRVTLFETYRDLDPEAKRRALEDYAFIADLAGAL